MTVQETIDLVNHGEFRQLSVSDDIPAVVSYINLGVLELYKRFVLNTNELIIDLGRDTTVDDNYVKISDSIYEMPLDFMYLTEAYEENGTTIPINKENDPLSINTISWNRIQVPTPTLGSSISLLYNAVPTFLASDALDAQVSIPPQLIEALLHYIGYRGHSSGEGRIESEQTTHYQRFEQSVARAKQLGLMTADDVYTDNRFAQKGFA